MTMAALAPQPVHAASSSIPTSELVRLTNADRATAGVSQLTVNAKLVAAAQAKADDMARNSYFAHVGPDGNNSWHWFGLVGYVFSSAGENLAVGYATAGEVEQGWLNSPTHRANLLSSKYTEVGIATAVGTYKGKPVVFVAQMFGRPQGTLAQAPKAPLASQTLPVTTTNANAEIVRLQALIALLQAQLKAANSYT